MKSVGEYPNKKFLCKSVKSVGEQSQQEVLCRSVKSVGEHQYSHRAHGIHITFLLRRASHRLHRLSQMLLTTHPNFCVWNLWENHSSESEICGRTYQQKKIYFLMLWSLRYCSKFAVEKLPQISQILTDVRACISPTESTDFTEFFSARKFCVNLWNLWENIPARMFCSEFCGRI